MLLVKNIFITSNYINYSYNIIVIKYFTILLDTKKDPDLKVKKMIIEYLNAWDLDFSFKYPRLEYAIMCIKQNKKVINKTRISLKLLNNNYHIYANIYILSI